MSTTVFAKRNYVDKNAIFLGTIYTKLQPTSCSANVNTQV